MKLSKRSRKQHSIIFFGFAFVLILLYKNGERKLEIKPRTRTSKTRILLSHETPEEFSLNKKRSSIFRRYIQGARFVIQKTGDDEARQMFQYCKKHQAQTKRIGGNFITKRKSQSYFFASVILPEDAQVIPKIYQSATSSSGSFHLGRRMLQLRGDQLLSLWASGIVYLHECFHIRCFFEKHNGNLMKYTDDITYMEERGVRIFHNRLFEKLGGKKYKNLLKNEIERIKTIFKKERLSFASHILYPTRYTVELDDVFGPSQSEQEGIFRKLSLRLHVYYIIYQQAFPKSLSKKLQQTLVRITAEEYPKYKHQISTMKAHEMLIRIVPQ